MKALVQLLGLFVALGASLASAETVRLLPDRVFDGQNMHEDWAVRVEGDVIVAVGPAAEVSGNGARDIDLAGQTLLPGLIEGHSHILLHPYDEVSWNDQVLKESIAERSVRGAQHLRAQLHSGFTTLRDLGAEGAGYADIGLKQALEKGVIEGPRLIVAGPAMVATGSYGPKGFADHVTVPLGAEEADGDSVVQVARKHIGRGADFIKVYADYRWGPDGTASATFSVAEMSDIRTVAELSGRYMVAHASSAGAMQNAISAGVRSIEHGDGGTPEIFAAMAADGIYWCPTLAAGEAISTYRGWQKGKDPEPLRIKEKKRAFITALEAGVPMCMGGDVGVYDHGDGVWEMELMVEYGMEPLQVLRSATSVNAQMMGLQDKIGSLAPGKVADMIAVDGNPAVDISTLRHIKFILQGGHRVLQ